ncbi:MAG: N-acetylneuraminate synthase family protein [Acidimicrobiia bacterium]
MSTIRLGSRTVGDAAACYIVAEAGANHDRDLATALRLIDVAAASGADAVKFQTYTGSALYSKHTPRFEYLGDLGAKPAHELLDDIALPRDWQPRLSAHAHEQGIAFMSSPFDVAAVDELDALDVPAFKIASFEIVDLPFIEYVGSKGRPIILSTGMATLDEIDEALAAARKGGATDFALLQCASLYPAPPAIMNLRAMATMRSAFGVPVGLSDHTLGIQIASAAVAMGADLVEKHFTLDRTRTGPDHAFAIEPDELGAMVRNIRDVEAALGTGEKAGPSDAEASEMYRNARRSIVAAETIPAGTVIAREMLTVKRPGFGIKPNRIDDGVGRVATRTIEFDEVVTWDLV